MSNAIDYQRTGKNYSLVYVADLLHVWRWLDVVQVGVSGGRRETVDIRDTLNNSVSTPLTVILRTSTGKVSFVHCVITKMSTVIIVFIRYWS